MLELLTILDKSWNIWNLIYRKHHRKSVLQSSSWSGMKMTSSNQEEKLCRYPSNDDPIDESIDFSKKTKTNPELVFVHIKKTKIITRGWFSCSYLLLVDCRCEAAETTPDRVLAFFVDFAGIVTIGHAVKYSLRRIAADCGNPSRVWRYDRRRLVWRPCIYKKLDASSEKTVILLWMTHAPWGNFSFWHRLWLYDADVSDDPSWNSMTLMPCFSIARQV